jgi:hypothetical protein
MLRQISPRLRRANVMLNSFGSCITNTPEKSSWAPEMPFGEIISQPRMFMQKFVGRIAFKQLQGFADRHCWRDFNKQMHMVNCNMQFVDFTPMFNCDFAEKSFTINFHSEKFKWVPSILGFPDKMESILSEGMFKVFQIHFFAPKLKQENIAHANFFNLVQEGSVYPLNVNKHKELNIEDGNSSIGLKAEVSLPLM